MPRFRVTFDDLIWYLPDHPRGRQQVTELIVNAPTAKLAEVHALRVTRGGASILSVGPTEARPAPAIEVPQDGATIVIAL